MSVTNWAQGSETQQAASVGFGSGGDGVPFGFVLVRVVEDGVEDGEEDGVENGVEDGI